MKKLTTLVLAAGLVVSAFAGSASAGEFKPVLQFAEEFTYTDAGIDDSENFNAATRIRFGFDYVASEDLSATILFQYRKGNWGHNRLDDDFTSDPEVNGIGGGDHFRMRLAYIDWTLPSTDVKVRMGRHAVVAPSYAFGSAVLDGRADGITVTGSVNENINLGFTWFRLDSGSSDYEIVDPLYASSKGKGFKAQDDADAVMLNAEFAYDGFKVAPWAMYVSGQEKSMFGGAYINSDLVVAGGNSYDAYVIGASAELNMFDPFVFAVDAMYQNAKIYNIPFADKFTESDSFDGFYVAAKASYKLSNGVASLGGWYATGEDQDKLLSPNDKAMFALDGGFSASTILFGDNIIGCDGYNTLTGDTPFGTWGLIAEYANFSFLENLSHTARVVYVKGTNESEKNEYGMKVKAEEHSFLDWSEDDSAIEFDFNSTYQIYKNFSATLELGYVFVDQSNLDFGQEEQDDIFRSALTFVYKF